MVVDIGPRSRNMNAYLRLRFTVRARWYYRTIFLAFFCTIMVGTVFIPRPAGAGSDIRRATTCDATSILGRLMDMQPDKARLYVWQSKNEMHSPAERACQMLVLWTLSNSADYRDTVLASPAVRLMVLEQLFDAVRYVEDNAKTQVLKDLRSSEPETRAYAVSALRSFESEDVFGPLEDAIKRDRTIVALNAVAALSSLALKQNQIGMRAVSLLEQLLMDKSITDSTLRRELERSFSEVRSRTQWQRNRNKNGTGRN